MNTYRWEDGELVYDGGALVDPGGSTEHDWHKLLTELGWAGHDRFSSLNDDYGYVIEVWWYAPEGDGCYAELWREERAALAVLFPHQAAMLAQLERWLPLLDRLNATDADRKDFSDSFSKHGASVRVRWADGEYDEAEQLDGRWLLRPDGLLEDGPREWKSGRSEQAFVPWAAVRMVTVVTHSEQLAEFWRRRAEAEAAQAAPLPGAPGA